MLTMKRSTSDPQTFDATFTGGQFGPHSIYNSSLERIKAHASSYFSTFFLDSNVLVCETWVELLESESETRLRIKALDRHRTLQKGQSRWR